MENSGITVHVAVIPEFFWLKDEVVKLQLLYFYVKLLIGGLYVG